MSKANLDNQDLPLTPYNSYKDFYQTGIHLQRRSINTITPDTWRKSTTTCTRQKQQKFANIGCNQALNGTKIKSILFPMIKEILTEYEI